MGPMNQIMSYLGFDVAMEAEDITKESESATDDVVGGNGEGENNNGEIDLNTDDILGTANTDDDPTNDTKSSDEESEEEGEDEGESDENNEGEDTTPGDGDTKTEDVPEQQEPENSFASNRKAKLRKQFLHFYDLLSDSCKLISEFMPSVTEEDTIQTLSSINKNLLQSKDEIYDILTEEFAGAEYHTLLKKYISLNHVYDLCVNTLDKYFKNHTSDEDRYKKKKKDKEK